MLHTHPAQRPPRLAATPALWICAPLAGDAPFSADVECLRWQAFLALRGIPVHLRTDIDPAGALDQRLPNLHAANDELLPANAIQDWASKHVPNDDSLPDESHAWFALLEGPVHAALLLAAPAPPLFSLRPAPTQSLAALLTPPPPPLTGLAALCPPRGARISPDVIYANSDEAIAALSHRLATDKWFLASPHPTPLDALVFAYLHCILASKLRDQVTRHVNLVAWEWRVRDQVRAAFQ
ncbi:hypothetical protein C0992_001813 [Termitomyces sp. T32_za158]|nr:hypothetical protein C0992_001813 [Termitomyces sp. T32_za158]